MIFIPDPKLFVNRFIEVVLPTKSQIFSRTGGKAVTPNGVFTGDDPALINRSVTEQAETFAREAESFEGSNSDE